MLLAVGAYGRRELCPASDLDLVLIHDGRRGRDVGRARRPALVPDLGLGLQARPQRPHAQPGARDRRRRPRRPRSDCSTRASSPATQAMGDKLVDRIAGEWRDRARSACPSSTSWSQERHRGVGRRRARARARPQGGAGRQPRRRHRAFARGRDPVVDARRPLAGAIAVLFDVRVALQRAAGRTDRLLLEHQDQVAELLGLATPTSSWTRVSTAARTIARQSDDAWRRCAVVDRGPDAVARPRPDRRCRPAWWSARARSRCSPTRRRPTIPRCVLRAAADAAYLGVADRRVRRCGASTPRSVRSPSPWTDDARVTPSSRCSVAATRWCRWSSCWTSTACSCLPAGVGAGAVQAATQRLPPLHRRPPPARGGGAAPTTSCARCAGPTSCSWARCSTTWGRAARRPHRQRRRARADGRHPHGLRRRRRRGARRPRAPPPAAARSCATGRDLEDPATIATVADAAGTEDTLDLLAALTVADSIATGPTAWSDWKAGLLDRLVERHRDELRRRGGDAGGRRTASPRDPHLDTFDGTLTVDPPTPVA